MNTSERVTDADIEAVFPGVAEIVADALAREPDEVRRDSFLIENLGAESIDFLDIVFRLERHFGVRIPRGQVLEDARGELSEEEFAPDGRVSDAGVARLRLYLDEVPAERFRPGLRLEEVPLLFTVETFCKVVVRAKKAES